MKKIILLVSVFISMCVHGRARAQELNIGIHANPILNTPIVGGKSVRNEDVKVGKFRPRYNVGFNVNFKFGSMSVELAANYVRKSVSVFNTKGSYYGQDLYYRTAVPSSCFEFPVMLNFLLDRHDNKTKYDAYLVAGVGYELSYTDSFASTATASSGGVNLDLVGKYTGPAFQSAVVPQVGFKINAILRNVGLIDYGLSFHLPISVVGPYEVKADIMSSQGNATQYSAVYVTAAFIDVKLCYYFYSIGKRFKRVKYRIV
jgi:hypothetical protein